VRAYVTITDGNTDLLPFFCRYYAEYGDVDEIFLCVFGTEEHRSVAHSHIINAGLRCVHGVLFPTESFLARRRVEYYQEVHRRGQWAYFTDLDEFPSHEAFDAVLALRRRSKAGDAFVGGCWLDRVAIDGKCKAVDPNHSLDEQYPMACRVRRQLKQLDNAFIAAPFAQTSHHPSVCRLARGRWSKMRKYDLHHFKWQENVYDRLENRKRRVRAVKPRHVQATHVNKALKYLAQFDGGVNTSKLVLAPRLGI